ncbi:FAD-dependent monooxygenase [Amycolatopsis sp. NPDC051716]|uniref:FAD-dependent monooxygenase n=1 Tax=Amycolatopsis sp. NPDC051716 TaxID=3155804 RepID=UPI0034222071
MPKRILISGASVAGPALAGWLGRSGWETTVVEAAPALRRGGYAVDFRGATHLEVLRRMGVLEAVRGSRTGGRTTRFVRQSGETILTMPPEFTGGDLEIPRSALSRLLYERSREHVDYVFGDKMTSIVQDADGVEVTFLHGSPRRFDLVIGADGMHSGVRRIAFGPEEDYVTGLGYRIAGWDVPAVADLHGETLVHNAPGTLVSVFPDAEDPSRANVLCLYAAETAPLDLEEQLRELRRRFAGHGWLVPSLLDGLAGATDVYCDTIARVDVPRWRNGRVALLGDAACGATLTGMGTGTAVVGAYVLAHEIAAAGPDFETAFARYESSLRPYARRGQAGAGKAVKMLVPTSGAAIWLRDRFLSTALGRKLALRDASKEAEVFRLPDYRTVRTTR